MDTRSSILIVGLYGLAAALIAAIVGAAFYWQRGGLRDQLALQAEAMSPRNGGGGASLARDAVSGQEFLAAHHAAEVERLRRLLDQKNQALAERAALLQKRTGEYQKLKADYQTAAALAVQFLDASGAGAPGPANDASAGALPEEPSGEPVREEAAPATPVEVATLREELNKTRLLENVLAEEVEQLQIEILAAESEIARIRQQAQDQAEQMLADEQQMREAASEALTRIGEPAIPVLVDALRDERPAVRRWAALMLADLGPAAPNAVGPLMDALGDREESVRTAAAQALRAIGTQE